jgi:phage gp29-like protein
LTKAFSTVPFGRRFAALLGLMRIPSSNATRPRAIRAKASPSKSVALNSDLARIVRPQASYRWLFNQLSQLTPTYIEQILRGALAGSHIQAWQLFWLMEDTWPRLGKNLNEVKTAVQQLDWQITPWQDEDEPPTASAKERAKVVSNACRTMRPDPANVDNGWRDTIYDVMDAFGKGSSVLEIEWEVRNAGKLGEIMAPKSTIWVHPTCYAWSSEGRLGLNANILRGDTYGRNETYDRPYTYDYDTSMSPIAGPVVDFPPDKFILAFNKSSTGSPLGNARLRKLAWWWCASNFSASWMMQHAQIFGLPLRWATYPTGTDDKTIQKICNHLDQMGEAAWAAFPEGVVMELKEGGDNSVHSPNQTLQDRADKNCDLLILGQSGTSEVAGPGKSSGGSRAANKILEGVKEEVVEAAGDWCADVLNQQLNPAIIRQTYGEDDPQEVPVWRPKAHEEKDFGAMATWMVQLAGIGFQFGSDWAHKQFDVPIPTDGEDVLEMPEPVAPPKPEANSDDKEPDGDEPVKNPVEGKATAPETKLERNALHPLAHAVALDLEPVGNRLRNILSIADPDIFRIKMDAFQKDLPKLMEDINKDPKSAHELMNVISSAMAHGLTERRKVVK